MYVYVYIYTHAHIYMDIYNGILLSHIKEYHNAICIDMGGPGDCQLSEVNQRKANITRNCFYVESGGKRYK